MQIESIITFFQEMLMFEMVQKLIENLHLLLLNKMITFQNKNIKITRRFSKSNYFQEATQVWNKYHKNK